MSPVCGIFKFDYKRALGTAETSGKWSKGNAERWFNLLTAFKYGTKSDHMKFFDIYNIIEFKQQEWN